MKKLDLEYLNALKGQLVRGGKDQLTPYQQESIMQIIPEDHPLIYYEARQDALTWTASMMVERNQDPGLLAGIVAQIIMIEEIKVKSRSTTDTKPMNEQLVQFKNRLIEKTLITQERRNELMKSIPLLRSLSYYQGRQEVLLEIALEMIPRPNCDHDLLGVMTAQIIVLEDIIDQFSITNN